MIPSKNNMPCVRVFIICCAAVSLTICHTGWSQTVLRFPSRGGKDMVITTVDWYKPATKDSEDYPPSVRVYITGDLIQNVPRSLHSEATKLLGNAEVVELTQQQAKIFGFRAEPHSVLRTLIQKTKEDVQGYQKEIAEYKSGRHPYVSSSQAKQDVEGYQRLLQDKNAEIKQYQEWMGRLRPYLIKGAALTYLPSGVNGYLIHSKDFILDFGAVLPWAGGHLTMKRMPTVVYLPIKPQHVFTNMNNLY